MTSSLYTCERVAETNGSQINYDVFGNEEAPTIILIMGLATQMIFWDVKFCESLASSGYRVIRFDNRDVGKSTWYDTFKPPSYFALFANVIFGRALKAPYNLEDMANDTLGLMDVLKIKQAHIVGASMGGMIAQLVVINAPERVKSLTSIMSTTGDRRLPKPKLAFLSHLFTRPPKQVDKFIPFGLSLWKALHGSTYKFQTQEVTDLLKLSLSRGLNQQGHMRQLAAILSSSDRTQALKKVKVPSLVIHGDSDPLIPVACGCATAKAISGAKLVVYPGMGHTLPNELLHNISDNIIELIRSTE